MWARTRRRIIPARAGSTRAVGSGTCPGSDHPRSRGVDSSRVRSMSRAIGSSPLARGRPPMAADFSHVEVDHPRSRGVDTIPKRNLSSPSGSSPLARGRHGVRPGVSAPRWIIPARAGSTCSTWPRRPREPDHPRSRGVDTVMSHCPGVAPGSSPLARGRLVSGGGASDESGIIPARAGSTLQRVWAWVTGTDHPRSRGVDLMPFMAVDTADGSSPLARGRR